MKNINEITKNIKEGHVVSVDDHELQHNISPKAKVVVDELFSQLSAIFPAWKHNWKTDEDVNSAKIEWVKALYENKIDSTGKIKIGLMKARKSDSDFLPSPGKFITWCKRTPEDAGWPSIDKAMKSCIRHCENKKRFDKALIYIRPMIIELCKKVDWFFMARQPDQKKTEAHFKEAYQELFDSGYVEPEKSDSLALPTKVQVMKNMSQANRDKEKNKALSVLDKLKQRL